MSWCINWNDRSRIAQWVLLLCGTKVSGDIFKFLCGLFLILSHLMIWAWPWHSFSFASAQRYFAVSGVFAERCGPRLTAASRCSRVHGGLQSTGHPAVAYWRRVSYAGWFLMLGSGHMRLCNELLYLLCVGVILGCWACVGGMLVIPIIAWGHLRLGDGVFLTALSHFSLLWL